MTGSVRPTQRQSREETHDRSALMSDVEGMAATASALLRRGHDSFRHSHRWIACRWTGPRASHHNRPPGHMIGDDDEISVAGGEMPVYAATPIGSPSGRSRTSTISPPGHPLPGTRTRMPAPVRNFAKWRLGRKYFGFPWELSAVSALRSMDAKAGR